MITYFDASAFVPLFVNEPGTPVSRQLWDASDQVVSSQTLYVETAAALAQARRLDRLSYRGHTAAVRLLDKLWPGFTVIDVDAKVVTRAGVLANRESLRAYDAVHCASAESANDGTLLVASGDRALLAACSRLGMTTADTARG